MKNIYYNPEEYKLTVVAEIEYSGGNYEFDTRVVWKKETGELVTARDSGCSCPTPFEDITYAQLDNVSLFSLETEVNEEKRNTTPEERELFLTKVRGAWEAFRNV